MARPVSVFLLILVLTTGAFSAGKGPDIRIVDNKVSIQADAISLARLLHLLDLATGLNSTIPPQFANRSVSVQFSDLDVNAAIHKIFEGQMLDYIFVDRQGITVTAASQSAAAAPASPAPREVSPFQPGPSFPPDQPVFGIDPATGAALPPGGIPGQVNPFGNNQAQPAVIQTPFGPIPNPRLNQPQGQQTIQQGAPGTMPFGGAIPFGGGPSPFGPPSPPTPGPTAAPSIPTTIVPITTAPLAVPAQQPATKP